MPDLDLLRRIESAYLQAASCGRDVVEVGPFRLLLSKTSELFFLNGALPVEQPKEGWSPWIPKLIEAYREKGKKPFFEFAYDLWPDLPHTLIEHGFVEEARRPIMICEKSDFVPPPKDEAIEIEILDENSDFQTYQDVGSNSFEMAREELTPERQEDRRNNVRIGGYRPCLASYDGVPAGVGCTVTFEGVGELAGIGTIPEYRRKGIAGAVCARLMEEFFKTGDLLWLTPGDSGAASVYEKVGFRRTPFAMATLLLDNL